MNIIYVRIIIVSRNMNNHLPRMKEDTEDFVEKVLAQYTRRMAQKYKLHWNHAPFLFLRKGRGVK